MWKGQGIHSFLWVGDRTSKEIEGPESRECLGLASHVESVKQEAQSSPTPWHGLTAVEQAWQQGDFSRGADSELPALPQRCGKHPPFQSPKKGSEDRCELVYLWKSHVPGEGGEATKYASS